LRNRAAHINPRQPAIPLKDFSLKQKEPGPVDQTGRPKHTRVTSANAKAVHYLESKIREFFALVEEKTKARRSFRRALHDAKKLVD
jgi:hypothetical protein